MNATSGETRALVPRRLRSVSHADNRDADTLFRRQQVGGSMRDRLEELSPVGGVVQRLLRMSLTGPLI